MAIEKRDRAIDCLRGFSILSVLATHGVLPSLPVGNVAKNFGQAWGNGYYGVTIFFVISGFLITSKAIERYGRLDRIDSKDFYMRRLKRIAPCLALVLTLVCILHIASFPSFVTADPVTFWRGILNALFLQSNWFYASWGNIPGLYPIAPLWSLSVEEVFYIAFPIGCLLLVRSRALVAALLILVIVAAVYRQTPQDFYLLGGTTDGLALGCLAAIAAAHFAGIEARGKGAAGRILRYGGLATIAFVYMKTRAQDFATLNISLIAVGAAIYLLGNAVSKPWISLKLGIALFLPMSVIGSLSYELYLFHWPFKAFAEDIGIARHLGGLYCYILGPATLGLAYIADLLIRRTTFAIGRARFEIKGPANDVDREPIAIDRAPSGVVSFTPIPNYSI